MSKAEVVRALREAGGLARFTDLVKGYQRIHRRIKFTSAKSEVSVELQRLKRDGRVVKLGIEWRLVFLEDLSEQPNH